MDLARIDYTNKSPSFVAMALLTALSPRLALLASTRTRLIQPSDEPLVEPDPVDPMTDLDEVEGFKEVMGPATAEEYWQPCSHCWGRGVVALRYASYCLKGGLAGYRGIVVVDGDVTRTPLRGTQAQAKAELQAYYRAHALTISKRRHHVLTTCPTCQGERGERSCLGGDNGSAYYTTSGDHPVTHSVAELATLTRSAGGWSDVTPEWTPEFYSRCNPHGKQQTRRFLLWLRWVQKAPLTRLDQRTMSHTQRLEFISRGRKLSRLLGLPGIELEAGIVPGTWRHFWAVHFALKAQVDAAQAHLNELSDDIASVAALPRSDRRQRAVLNQAEPRLRALREAQAQQASWLGPRHINALKTEFERRGVQSNENRRRASAAVTPAQIDLPV